MITEHSMPFLVSLVMLMNTILASHWFRTQTIHPSHKCIFWNKQFVLFLFISLLYPYCEHLIMWLLLFIFTIWWLTSVQFSYFTGWQFYGWMHTLPTGYFLIMRFMHSHRPQGFFYKFITWGPKVSSHYLGWNEVIYVIRKSGDSFLICPRSFTCLRGIMCGMFCSHFEKDHLDLFLWRKIQLTNFIDILQKNCKGRLPA